MLVPPDWMPTPTKLSPALRATAPVLPLKLVTPLAVDAPANPICRT